VHVGGALIGHREEDLSEVEGLGGRFHRDLIVFRGLELERRR
jgi:hypothetical protein